MAQQPSAPARTGETVTVACKLPSGLVMRMFRRSPRREPVPNGSNAYKEYEQYEPDPTVPSVRIAGPGGVQFGQPRVGVVVGHDGYALTPGVPKDLWEAWRAQNADLDLVTNNLIFARANDVEALAREHAGTRTGLEPVDPDQPGKRVGTRAIQKDDGR